MADEKKDLTSIIVYAKKLQDSGEAPPVPEGSLLEEIPIEKIDDFESLDDYAKANPMPDPQENPPPPVQPQKKIKKQETPQELKPNEQEDERDSRERQMSAEDTSPSSPPHDPLGDSPRALEAASDSESGAQTGFEDPFASTLNHSSETPTSDPFSPTPADSSESGSIPPSEFETTPASENLSDDPFAVSVYESTSEPGFDFTPPTEGIDPESEGVPTLTESQALEQETPAIEPPTTLSETSHSTPEHTRSNTETAATTPTPETPEQGNVQLSSSQPTPQPSKAPASPQKTSQSSPGSGGSKGQGPGAGHPTPPTPLEKVRQFAQNHPSVQPKAVPASFPFSVLIEGLLSPAEQEKLIDLLSRENMGIREIDLEPQLQSGRILIPRISEYAAVLLVQSLRNISAKMRIGPSDQIFTSQAAQKADPQRLIEGESQEQIIKLASGALHKAEQIPMTQDNSLPELPSFRVIDTLSATATVRAKWVAAESSYEYQSVIEALQRELKYKAFHRGAHAIVSFRIQLNPINTSQDYRLLALGTAIQSLDLVPDSTDGASRTHPSVLRSP